MPSCALVALRPIAIVFGELLVVQGQLVHQVTCTAVQKRQNLSFTEHIIIPISDLSLPFGLCEFCDETVEFKMLSNSESFEIDVGSSGIETFMRLSLLHRLFFVVQGLQLVALFFCRS